MKVLVTIGALVFGLSGVAVAQTAPRADDVEKRVAEVPGEKVWREIAWRRCLVEAYAESRQTNKPLFIYAIAGDPTGRC